MIVFHTTREVKATIVIVHGAGEHHERYYWLIHQLNENGFHVVTGDLPGQGRTTGRRGHVQSFTEYLDTVERWLNEANSYNQPILLFGHSMGGLIVIRTLIERAPAIKAVILSSPCLGLVNNLDPFTEWMTKWFNFIIPWARFPSNLEPGSGTRNEAMKARDKHDRLYNRKVSIRWYRELRKAMGLAHKETSRFPDVPLLLLQAGDDRIVNKEAVKEWFKHVQVQIKDYKEWEALFHEVFNEPEREEVLNYTLRFIWQQLQNV